MQEGRHEGAGVGRCLGLVRTGHKVSEKASLRKVSLLFAPWDLEHGLDPHQPGVLISSHSTGHVVHVLFSIYGRCLRAADSPNELQALDPGKAYIVGGLVDRNRHKALCARKAREQGVATARLPVGQHFKLTSSAVLTVNQARVLRCPSEHHLLADRQASSSACRRNCSVWICIERLPVSQHFRLTSSAVLTANQACVLRCPSQHHWSSRRVTPGKHYGVQL